MSSPIALTINVTDLAPKALPASLEARLVGSPTRSPEDLSAEIAKHTEASAKLRQAHLDAVRDRAARESQRANDAKARKLRIAANRIEKIQNKMDAASTKSSFRKEAVEAEREARKARREALAEAVKEARQTAVTMRAVRQAELATAEANAQAKHSKAIYDVKTKGAWQVKHAIAVAAAKKEKEALAAAALGEKQTARLNAAETRRELAAASPRRSVHDENLEASPLHRVRNEGKVASEMRRLLNEASMAKASEKRAAFLATVTAKAANVSAKAAAVVAKATAKSKGTDEATAEARAAMYERLLRAEVARLSALKAKYGKAKGETTSVIVVRMDDVLSPRAPPAALTLRLAVVSRTLAATAGARQAGAASRRLVVKHAALLKVAKANERRAAALTRAAKVRAAVEAKVTAKAARSLVTHALAMGKRAHVLSQEHGRIHAASLKRQAMAKGLKAAGAARDEKGAAVAERHAAKLRLVAKPGVVAVRLAANKSRREAMASASVKRAAFFSVRGTCAAAKRAALLEKRVEVARKRMKALHPRREMPDEEVKSEFSDA